LTNRANFSSLHFVTEIVLSFRYKLQPASFRGVPFEVSSAESSIGRRTVVHEFPLGDTPISEDMGRKAGEFIVEGFIIGDDYLTGMRRLIGALIAAGPGTLVHPSMGVLDVVLAQPGRLRESFIERRGMVSFSLSFIEISNAASPSIDFVVAREGVDTQKEVGDFADQAYVQMQRDFASKFSVAGAPDWSVQGILAEIGKINEVVSSVRYKIRFDLSSLSQLVRAGTVLQSNIIGLLATPNALFTELSAQFRGLVSLFDFSSAQGSSINPTASINSLKSFGNNSHPSSPMRQLLPLAVYGQLGSAYSRPAIPTTTPIRRQQAASQAALFALVARCSVVEAVRSSIYLPFASADESIAVRDMLYDALDTLMLDAPDGVYASLHDLRTAMVRDITARGADLAQLSAMTLSASMPAQVLSYQQYGTGAYAAELLQRNQATATVMHPLFVPGGQKLELRHV
jgi:prophage DNA circulation protein